MLNLVKPLVLELLRRIDGSAAIIKALTQQVTQITMENTTLVERLLAASQVPPATDKEIQGLKDELTMSNAALSAAVTAVEALKTEAAIDLKEHTDLAEFLKDIAGQRGIAIPNELPTA